MCLSENSFRMCRPCLKEKGSRICRPAVLPMPMIYPSLRAAAFSAAVFILSSAGVWAGYFSRVVIDPGHGGDDRGGRSGKVYEKHLALDTAMRLEHYLREKGYQVTMTRKSDTFISLAKRAAIGNRFKGAIFVSLHYNYTWRRSVSGPVSYTHLTLPTIE